MLGSTEPLLILVDVVLGGVATFLAIHLWSRTREPAWMFLIVAVIAWFGAAVFGALQQFGIVSNVSVIIAGVEVFPIVLRAVTWLLLIVALSNAIRSSWD